MNSYIHIINNLFLQVCNHSGIISVQYYRDSSISLQDNICQNVSRAIDLFYFNKTEFQRHTINFYYRRDSGAERRCKRILSQLKNARNNVSANLDIKSTNCTSEIKQIAGSLNIQALKMVGNISQYVFSYITYNILDCRCVHNAVPTSRTKYELPTSQLQVMICAKWLKKTCHPEEGCLGPIIPGI